MDALVVRLAGIRRPETKVFQQPEISIGTSPECDLHVDADPGMLPENSLLLRVSLGSGTYRITAIDPLVAITRHGEVAAVGDPIHDGDTFYFGETGIRLRIFALTERMELAETLQVGTAVLAHARTASLATTESNALAANSGAVAGRPAPAPRTDIALVFVKQLLRELVNEIPRKVLYLTIGVIGLIVGTIVYVNTLSFLEGRRNRGEIAKLNETVGAVSTQMNQMRDEVQKAADQSKFVLGALSAAARIVENYGPGVSLVYGTYTFVDARSGREARFREPSETSNPIGPAGTVNLSVNGTGPPFEVEFIGTGFLVSKGIVLTNRHVVQPWIDDPVASMIRGQGYQPRLKDLYTYFPKVNQPFALKQLDVDRTRDLALCSFNHKDETLPILPLDEAGEGAVSGQPVVLIGYPAGIEGLLARVDADNRLGFGNRRNIPLQQLLNELAHRAEIRPQSTQGHIGDVSGARIVYDAQTGEGGSGGPVFGANGKVVAVNQAILPGTPSNFGIPIRYGIDMLRKHVPDTEAAAKAGAAGQGPTTN